MENLTPIEIVALLTLGYMDLILTPLIIERINETTNRG